MSKVNDDPAPRQADDAAHQSEPAPDGSREQQTEPAADADERTPEEDGYGYGV